MDAQSYNAALTHLRTLRGEIKKARAALARLEADRDKQVNQLTAYDKAKVERIAPAAGLSVADVVALASSLAPDTLSHDTRTPAQTPAAPRAAVETEPAVQPEVAP
ncbi:hypothetical protein [Streptomyces sp. SP2-10]|uniref:hypothetical protein n=1 Tax=Streptomyces sp. SP2-10 TaxID=2873385 RepID=UPI001CA7AED8|nr:hypothetical protein [Streptomyces sp. SP2-10]MBY8844577.1 hypothetical protein [Streptomyces sp. SP2-10]